MMNISWDKPQYTVLFIFIVIVVFLFYNLKQWRKSAMRNFADSHLQSKLFSHVPSQALTLKTIFLILSLVFVILSLMGPMWGEEQQKLRREGIDIVFALDLSNSMNAEDIAPSRLEKAKMLMENYIATLGGDRVGLVVFAGEAYQVSPLTTDYSSLISYIENVSPYLLWDQGTNFRAAIHSSIEVLGNSPDTSKAIILISDGEDHEPGIDDAIKKAKEKKIEIFTLGVGNSSAVPIPVYNEYGGMEYKTDNYGHTILTSFDGNELRSIAEKSGGAYIKIESIKEALSSLKSNINTLEKKSSAETFTLNKKQQFQWFLGIAILFLFMYNLTPSKRINA